jgi:hypothetical protein
MGNEGDGFPVQGWGLTVSHAYRDIRGKYTPDERKGHFVIYLNWVEKKRGKIKK